MTHRSKSPLPNTPIPYRLATPRERGAIPHGSRFPYRLTPQALARTLDVPLADLCAVELFDSVEQTNAAKRLPGGGVSGPTGLKATREATGYRGYARGPR